MDNTERRGIGKMVERSRLEKGWSKEEAARQARMSSITWKRIEDGQSVQDTKMAAALQVLGIQRDIPTDEAELSISDEMVEQMARLSHEARRRMIQTGEDPEVAARRLLELIRLGEGAAAFADKAAESGVAYSIIRDLSRSMVDVIIDSGALTLAGIEGLEEYDPIDLLHRLSLGQRVAGRHEDGEPDRVSPIRLLTSTLSESERERIIRAAITPRDDENSRVGPDADDGEA